MHRTPFFSTPIQTLHLYPRFFGIWDFPYFKLGVRDLKAKSGRDSGLKVCAGGGIPKITLGIEGSNEIAGRDYGIEETYWGPSSEGVCSRELPLYLKSASAA